MDAKPFNEKYEYRSITWRECTIRTWLNKDFINRAFTVEEQSAILLANVDNSSSQGYDKRGKSYSVDNTKDKVFLLSYAEANKYLYVPHDDDNTKFRVVPTAYAKAQGAWMSDVDKTADGEVAGWWWSRSPGNDWSKALLFFHDGSFIYYDADARGGVCAPLCG